jgi:hypothetical protein
MKNPLIKASALIIVLSLMVSCKKYPDGPGFSLRPKNWRLSGTWQLEQMLIDGQDVTNAYYPNREFWEGYEVGGYYEYTIPGIVSPTDTGTWKWVNNRTEILRSVSAFGSSALAVKVLRLRNKSFWYTFTSNNQVYEIHLEQD